MAVVVVVRGEFTISASGSGINQSIIDKLSWHSESDWIILNMT